ncbi:MAG: hypothetical protein ABII27_03660 [bacterium]
MKKIFVCILLISFLSLQFNYSSLCHGSAYLAPPVRTELNKITDAFNATREIVVSPLLEKGVVDSISLAELDISKLFRILTDFDVLLREQEKENLTPLVSVVSVITQSLFKQSLEKVSNTENDHKLFYGDIINKYISAKKDGLEEIADYYKNLFLNIVVLKETALTLIIDNLSEIDPDSTEQRLVYKDLISALFDEEGVFDKGDFSQTLIKYVNALNERRKLTKPINVALKQVIKWFLMPDEPEEKEKLEKILEEENTLINWFRFDESIPSKSLLIKYYEADTDGNSYIETYELKFPSTQTSQTPGSLRNVLEGMMNFYPNLSRVKKVAFIAAFGAGIFIYFYLLAPIFILISVPLIQGYVSISAGNAQNSDFNLTSMGNFPAPAFASLPTKTIPKILPPARKLHKEFSEWEDSISDTNTGLQPSHVGDQSPVAVKNGFATGGFTYDEALAALRHLILTKDYAKARKYVLYFAERFIKYSAEELSGKVDENNVYGFIRLLPSPFDGVKRKHIINCIDTSSSWTEGNGIIEWYTDGGPQSFLLGAALQSLRKDSDLSRQERKILEQFVQELGETILGLFSTENIVSAGPALQDIDGAPAREHLGHIENMHDHYSFLHQLANYLEENHLNPRLASRCRKKADSIYPELKKRGALVKEGDEAFFYQGFAYGKINPQIPVDVQSWGILSSTTMTNAKAISSVGPKKLNEIFGEGTAEGMMNWLLRNALVLTDYIRPDGYEVTTIGSDFSDPHLSDIQAQRGGIKGQITDEWTAGVICAMDVMAGYYYEIGLVKKAENLLAMADALRYFAFIRATERDGMLYWEYATERGMAVGYGWNTPNAPGGSTAGTWMLFALDHRGNPFDPEGHSLRNLPGINRLGIRKGIELLLVTMKDENTFSNKSLTMPGSKITKVALERWLTTVKKDDRSIHLGDPRILKEVNFYSAIGKNKGMIKASKDEIGIQTITSWNSAEVSFQKMQDLSKTPFLTLKVRGEKGAKAVRINVVDDSYIQAKNWKIPPPFVMAEIHSDGEWHTVTVNLDESGADISKIRAISFDVGMATTNNPRGANVFLKDYYFIKHPSSFSIPESVKGTSSVSGDNAQGGFLSRLKGIFLNKDEKPATEKVDKRLIDKLAEKTSAEPKSEKVDKGLIDSLIEKSPDEKPIAQSSTQLKSIIKPEHQALMKSVSEDTLENTISNKKMDIEIRAAAMAELFSRKAKGQIWTGHQTLMKSVTEEALEGTIRNTKMDIEIRAAAMEELISRKIKDSSKVQKPKPAPTVVSTNICTGRCPQNWGGVAFFKDGKWKDLSDNDYFEVTVEGSGEYILRLVGENQSFDSPNMFSKPLKMGNTYKIKFGDLKGSKDKDLKQIGINVSPNPWGSRTPSRGGDASSINIKLVRQADNRSEVITPDTVKLASGEERNYDEPTILLELLNNVFIKYNSTSAGEISGYIAAAAINVELGEIIAKTQLYILEDATNYPRQNFKEYFPNLNPETFKYIIRQEIIERLEAQEIEKPIKRKTVAIVYEALNQSLPFEIDEDNFKNIMRNYAYTPDVIISDMLRTGSFTPQLLFPIFNTVHKTLGGLELPDYDQVLIKSVLVLLNMNSNGSGNNTMPVDLDDALNKTPKEFKVAL